jgi:hypothetical protein
VSWFTDNDPAARTTDPASGSGTTPAPTTTSTDSASRTDPNAIRAQVAKWATMPGADPSLSNDPDYWVRTIIAKGGLGTDNQQYWQDASVGPNAFFNNPNRESGGVGMAGGAPANFGATPPTYTAPTWQGGAPPTATPLAQYSAPTQTQLEATPGYQARFTQGERAIEAGAAARGTILSGGTQKALARYGQDYASNEYNNAVGQGLAITGANNNATQTGFGNAFANYQARYGQFTDAANMGFNAFNTNVANTRNANTDYWTRLNDLYSTGAGLANNSYKP